MSNIIVKGDLGSHTETNTVVNTIQDFVTISDIPIAVNGSQMSTHTFPSKQSPLQQEHSQNGNIINKSQDFIQIDSKYVIVNGDGVSCGETVTSIKQSFVTIG